MLNERSRKSFIKMAAIQLPGGVGFGERIDHPYAGVSKTVLVAADHCEIVNECRRRQEGIEGRHRLSQAEATPPVGHTLVTGKMRSANSVATCRLKPARRTLRLWPG
jgi:hypothetical protein